MLLWRRYRERQNRIQAAANVVLTLIVLRRDCDATDYMVRYGRRYGRDEWRAVFDRADKQAAIVARDFAVRK